MKRRKSTKKDNIMIERKSIEMMVLKKSTSENSLSISKKQAKKTKELRKEKSTNAILQKVTKQPRDATDWTYVYLLLKFYFENNNLSILKEEFYIQDDVLLLTENLIGHILWVYDEEEKKLSASRMVELEAYNGISDKGSHAYNNNKTKRNASMFQKGGICYVYICYGIHNCLNIVTNVEDKPDAILIRSTEPIYNIPFFLENKLEKKGLEKEVKINLEEYEQKKDDKEIKKETNGSYNIEYDYHYNNCIQEIEILNKMLRLVNKKKVMKLCSGPGCVTKCLKITRKDDMERLYIDIDLSKIPTYEESENSHIFVNEIVNKIVNKKNNTNKNTNKNTNDYEKQFNENNYNEKNYNGNYKENDSFKQNKCKIEKKMEESYPFFSILKNCNKQRFFISECPKANEILDFFENKIKKEKDPHCFINTIYNKYRENFIEYLNIMKWYKEQITVQKDKRIGISYAEEAAFFEYRYILKDHPSVTFPPRTT